MHGSAQNLREVETGANVVYPDTDGLLADYLEAVEDLLEQKYRGNK